MGRTSSMDGGRSGSPVLGRARCLGIGGRVWQPPILPYSNSTVSKPTTHLTLTKTSSSGRVWVGEEEALGTMVLGPVGSRSIMGVR